MVTYRQLLDAKVETIQPQIDGWQKVSTTLESTRKRADKVGKGIRAGDWKGASEKAADVKSGFLGQQVAAAKTEVDSIKWILWRAQKLFNEVQTQLRDIVKQVEADPYLKIDGDGKVEIDLSGSNSVALGSDGSGQQIVQVAKQAARYNDGVKKLLQSATTMDSDVAKALRAVGRVDDPSDPNFNANAPKDGNLPLEKYMNDKYKLDFHYPPWLMGKYGGDDPRSPQELAAVLKNPTKYSLMKQHWAYADDQGATMGGGMHNGRGDAMKHTLLSALLARDLGENDARLLMDGHERGPNNPPQEEVMDRHNNEIGYRIARDNPHASNERLAELIRQEVNSGRTLSVNTDTKRIEYTDGVPRQD